MEKPEIERFEPPKSNIGDAIHTIVKGGISTIPVLGGTAAELFSFLIKPPLEKRRDEWMEEVGKKLQELGNKNLINFENLQTNEKFIDILLQTSRAAISTSSLEKRKALRNAILNSALKRSPDFVIQEMFISFIETLSEYHLKILKLYQDPSAWFKKYGLEPLGGYSGQLSMPLKHAFPELREKPIIYDQVWSDLVQRHLLTNSNLHGIITVEGAMSKRTSDLGDAFIKYIEEPLTD